MMWKAGLQPVTYDSYTLYATNCPTIMLCKIFTKQHTKSIICHKKKKQKRRETYKVNNQDRAGAWSGA